MIRIGDLVNVLTYLCAVLGYLAVARHLGWIATAGFWLLFTIAAHRDYSGGFAVRRWLLNLVSMVVLLHSFSSVRLDYVVEPVLDGLMFLVGIKLLEEKQNRDYLQVLGLCTFLLLGASLLSIHLSFMVFYVLLAFLATQGLVFLTIHSRVPDLLVERDHLVQCMIQALLIGSIALPVSGLFFIVLPRTDYPLLTFLNKVPTARSGFSDSITLGQVAAIQEDDSVIFRAEMDRIDEDHLYWRGVVLDVFDGKAWKSSRPELVNTVKSLQGWMVHQTIYLEPYGNKVLFALDRPASLRLQSKSGEREVTLFREAVQERVRYRAVSNLQDFFQEPEIEETRYLQLPMDFAPGVREMVTGMTSTLETGGRMVALFNFLREGGFDYSLDELPVSSTPLEDFLTVHKRGNCEYFASALGVMFRMANVPARLVAGYRGGVYNRTGHYYLVRQKNAHVWVEALWPGRGWLRLDPTPLGYQFGPLDRRADFLERMRVLMDTINHYWVKFVINYDLERQFRFFRNLREGLAGVHFAGLRGTLRLRILGIVGGFGLIAALVVLGAKRARRCPDRGLVVRFLRRMRKRGYTKGESQGLDEFVAAIEDEALRTKAVCFVDHFQALFYRDRPISGDDKKRLQSLIRDL
jgi:protein-glutamine gamma-glutamyltransferase